MKTLGARVDDDVYLRYQKESIKRNITISDVLRQSLGWELVEIYPEKLKYNKDTDLLMSMAMSELIPSNVIDVVRESLKHVSDTKKKETLEWILRRYVYVYENLKLINDEFIKVIDNDQIVLMGIVFESFAQFMGSVKKNKTNVEKFRKGCLGK